MKKIILLFLAIAGLLNAQQDDNTPPAISASIQTLGMGVASNDLYLKQGERYIRLPVMSGAMPNKAVTYKGPLVMPIFRKSGGAYAPVASVQFPAPTPNVADEFILLFSPAGAPALVRNDTTSFPPNTIRVINSLPTAAGILIKKDAPVVMQPGEVKLFPFAATDTSAEVHVAVSEDGNWREVANNIFGVSSSSRRTIFVVNNAPSGSQGLFINLLSMSQSNAPHSAAPSHGKHGSYTQNSSYAQDGGNS